MGNDPLTLNGTITLVLGGVRSGKSRFAQELAARVGGDDVLFVATAETRDDEMRERAQHHQRTRPATWHTLERPLGTGAAIASLPALPSVVLVDCLTLLVSNILCRRSSHSEGLSELMQCVEAEIDALITVAVVKPVHLIIVSGEVGLGIVPDHAMGRIFRDLLGWANQRVARCATTYWMVAGLALNASRLASSIDEAAAHVAAHPTRTSI